MNHSYKFRLRNALERAVHEDLAAEFGTDAVIMRPVNGGMITELPAPADPLQGLRVADRAELNIKNLIDKYTRRARGEGHSWEDVARALHLRGENPGIQAFERCRSDFYDGTVCWDCESCGQLVGDRGPAIDVRDREEGHAESCVRHREEIAAQQRIRDEQDAAETKASERQWRCEQ